MYEPLSKQNNFNILLEISLAHGASCALWNPNYLNCNINGYDKHKKSSHPVDKTLK